MYPTQLLLISLLPLLTSALTHYFTLQASTYGDGPHKDALKNVNVSASGNQFFMENQSEQSAHFVLKNGKLSLISTGQASTEQVYMEKHNGTVKYTNEYKEEMGEDKKWDHHIEGQHLTFQAHRHDKYNQLYACPVKPEVTGKDKQGDFSSVPKVWILVVGKEYDDKEDEKAAKAAKKGNDHEASKHEDEAAKKEKTSVGCVPVELRMIFSFHPVRPSPASPSASAGVKKTG